MKTLTANQYCLLLKVGVVANGSDCLSIMRMLDNIKPSNLRIHLVGISTVGRSVACNKYAGEMGIELFENHRDLLNIEYLNLILELTGDQTILADLIRHKSPTIGVLDRQASMLFFDIAKLFDHLDENAAEINLASSFASTLLEASPDGVLIVDRDFRIINCNDSPLVTGGAPRDDILGKYCFAVLHRSSNPCSSPERACPACETLRTGRPARTVHELQISENQSQICQVTTYPILSRFGEITQFVLTVRDMTRDLNERIEERAQAIRDDLSSFVQDDRLTSLGRLVASVCHEINNPITSIVTFNKLILSYVKDGGLPSNGMSDIQRYLELSIREALRCGDIVTNLLTFARQKSPQTKHIDLCEMVNTIILLTNHQMESFGIEYEERLPPAPFTALGDNAQIQQCLMNLVFNAIDAMPDGGKMVISGGINIAKDQIWIAISDTGPGIKTEDLPRIFEPFYSTKADGKGVGLGLSMVYGIIREHNGTVEVDSTIDKGTTFRIKLPRNLPDIGGKKE